MTYNRFDDSMKGPVLVNAEVGRSILSLSVGIHPKEILSVFPPQGVHLSGTFKEISTRKRAVDSETVTIHPGGSTLQSLTNVIRVRPETIVQSFDLLERHSYFCKLISLSRVLPRILDQQCEYAKGRSFPWGLTHWDMLLGWYRIRRRRRR